MTGELPSDRRAVVNLRPKSAKTISQSKQGENKEMTGFDWAVVNRHIKVHDRF